MTTGTDKLLLRPVEAAAAIGVSRAWIYRLIADGTVPSVRIGTAVRVPVVALQRWIDQQTTQK